MMFTAQEVRSIWLDLLKGASSENETIDRLRAVRATTSPAMHSIIEALVGAIVDGDRRWEATLFRRLECAAPFGFPSEVSLGDWRFDPVTGHRIDRYAR